MNRKLDEYRLLHPTSYHPPSSPLLLNFAHKIREEDEEVNDLEGLSESFDPYDHSMDRHRDSLRTPHSSDCS